jgi:hypothetical protein
MREALSLNPSTAQKKVKHRITIPAIPFPCIHPKELKIGF